MCTIIVSGFATPSWFSSDPNLNGEYAPVESKGVNGRGVWKNDKCFLYYAQQQKEGDGRWHWWISVKEDMEAGTPKGYAKVASEAMVPQHIEDTWQHGWTDVNDVKVVAVDGRVLVELRDVTPSLQQKHGWDALSRLSDLARLSLDGITIVDGQVTELKLISCGLTSKSGAK